MDSTMVDDEVCIGWFIMFRDLLSTRMLHGASVFVCEGIGLVVGLLFCLSVSEVAACWDLDSLGGKKKTKKTFVKQKTSGFFSPPRPEQLQDEKDDTVLLFISSCV